MQKFNKCIEDMGPKRRRHISVETFEFRDDAKETLFEPEITDSDVNIIDIQVRIHDFAQ